MEEYPNLGHDEITGLVRAKWSKMSEEEKSQYEKSGTKHVNDLKKKVAMGKKLVQKFDSHIHPVGAGFIVIQLLIIKSHVPFIMTQKWFIWE